MQARTQGYSHVPMVMVVVLLLVAPSISLPTSAAPQGALIPWPVQDHPLRVRLDVGPLPYDELQLPLEFNISDSHLAAAVDWNSIIIIESHKAASGWVPVVQRSSPGGTPGLEESISRLLVPARLQVTQAGQEARVRVVLPGITTAGTVRTLHLYFQEGPTSGMVADVASVDPVPYAALDSLGWLGPLQHGFGYNPGTESSVAGRDGVTVVGLHDGTSYTIRGSLDGQVLASGTLVEGQARTHDLPDGIHLRIDATRPLHAFIGAFGHGGGAAILLPADDGGPWGSRFTFEQPHHPQWFGVQRQTSVYTAAPTNVTVSVRAGGSWDLLQRVRISPPRGTLNLTEGEVYRVVSEDGTISILSGSINGFSALPALLGGPQGKTFETLLDPFDDQVLLAQGGVSAQVVVRDGVGTLIAQGNGTDITFAGLPHDLPLRIQSDQPITLLGGSTEGAVGLQALGDDTTFLGGSWAEEFQTHSLRAPPPSANDTPSVEPSASVVATALHWSVQVRIDDTDPQTLGPGRWLDIPEGTHRIRSDGPLSVQLLGRGGDDGDTHRWNDFGTAIAGIRDDPPTTLGPPQRGARLVAIEPGRETPTIQGQVIIVAAANETPLVSLAVHNIGQFDDRYLVQVQPLPAAGPSPPPTSLYDDLALAASELEPFLLALPIPANASAGDRFITRVTAVSRTASEVSDSLLLTVVIDPDRLIDIGVEQRREILPWEVARFPLRVTNLGNGPETVTLSARGSPSTWDLSVDRLEASLAPSGWVPLNATVTPPPQAQEGWEATLQVDAAATDDPTVGDWVELQVVIARFDDLRAEVLDPALTLPAGGTHDLLLQLRNDGNGQETPTLQVLLPTARKGDVLVAPTQRLAAEPYSASQCILRWTAAAQAPPGTFEVILRVSGQSNVTDIPVQLTILPRHELELWTNTTRLVARPGDAMQLNATLQNIGTATDQVTLWWQQTDTPWVSISSNGTIQSPPMTSAVAAGRRLALNVSLSAPYVPGIHPQRLRAVSSDGSQVWVTIDIEVVPEHASGNAQGSIPWLLLVALGLVAVVTAAVAIVAPATNHRQPSRRVVPATRQVEATTGGQGQSNTPSPGAPQETSGAQTPK